MARPRLVSDQKIIAEAYDLLMESGPESLTFERLAARVGLVPAALVRRFKNKQALLLAVDRFALERTDIKVQEAMESAVSPIDAIIAQFTTELEFASTLERFAHGQKFLLMAFQDKELYANYRLSFEHRHQQIVDLLVKAQHAGELEEIEDPSLLARHLEMLLHGAGHVWAMTQHGSIEDYIKRHVGLALAPYRKQKRRVLKK